MPIDDERIRSDVGIVMKEAVTSNAPVRPSDYNEGIVPGDPFSNPPLRGLGANEAWWGGVLRDFRGLLEHRNPFYRILVLLPRDAQDTVGIPIADTNNMLTERIMKAAAKTGVV